MKKIIKGNSVVTTLLAVLCAISFVFAGTYNKGLGFGLPTIAWYIIYGVLGFMVYELFAYGLKNFCRFFVSNIKTKEWFNSLNFVGIIGNVVIFALTKLFVTFNVYPAFTILATIILTIAVGCVWVYYLVRKYAVNFMIAESGINLPQPEKRIKDFTVAFFVGSMIFELILVLIWGLL